MMKTSRGKMLLVIGGFLLIVFGLSANMHKVNTARPLSPERIEQLRKHYPVFNDDPPNYFFKPISYQEVIKRSESVIVAEAIGELPEYEIDLSGEPGTPEHAVNEKKKSNNLLTSRAKYTQFEVNVNNYYFSKVGTYYIVDNVYVLSAIEDDFSKYMNGKTVKELLKEIKMLHGK